MPANTAHSLPARAHGLVPSMSRLGWLIGLQEENLRQLRRLFAPQALADGVYLSRVGDGLDVRLEVLANHRYTQELRLSYLLCDPLTGTPDPSAHIRLYHDAGLAEATHCYVGRRWQDVIGLDAPARRIIGHRVRMNTFLGKWLDYLAAQGHGVATLQRSLPAPLDAGHIAG